MCLFVYGATPRCQKKQKGLGSLSLSCSVTISGPGLMPLVRLTNVSFACQKQLTSFSRAAQRSAARTSWIMPCLAFKNNLVDNTPLVLSHPVRHPEVATTKRSFPSWRASSVVTCHNKCGSGQRAAKKKKRRPECKKKVAKATNK